jgi:UDP-glucose 4-epimerase
MSISAGSTIAITGGAGFIGSALVRQLLDRGCTVLVLDDLSQGSRGNLPDHPRLTLHEIRVEPGNATEVEAILAASDFVYHLASPIGVALAHKARFQVVESILDSGCTVIKACRKLRLPLLLTSSSEVYGEGRDRPISENDPITVGSGSRWGYATAKAALEHYAAALSAEHGVPAWLVRPFNVAGPRQRAETGLVVPRFVANAIAGRPLEIHGDGSQKRSFLHVEEAAEALIRIAFNERLKGIPVNLGSEAPVAIGELAETVRRVLRVDVPIVNLKLDAIMGGEFTPVGVRVPNISRLRDATGWSPVRPIESVIQDCAATLSGSGSLPASCPSQLASAI